MPLMLIVLGRHLIQLACWQKLIAYDHLEGDPGLEGGKNASLFTDILNMVCGCVDNSSSDRGIDLESTVMQHDALLLFRTLCKMGMKEEGDEVTTKTRLLSLELLQGLLEGVSESFTKNFHFIDSVKAYLSYALLRASVSPFPVVFQYATGIFAVLLLRFRESLKFSGLEFDTAIREFLKGFRLPGEAQKIDRIMEKFAERYNTAYVLAYAVIMLNTDAHNPMVWPKMSKSDFIRMNSMSDIEECAPKELLEKIYDSIVREEIKMKNDTSGASISSKLRPEAEERGRLVNILNLALPKKKSGIDTKTESEKIKKQIQALFKNKGEKRGVFYTAQQIDLVRPMLEAVGWPLLATFSVTLEEGDNKPRVILCMEGFRAGIHLTRVLGMDTMRYAFLTSLVRDAVLQSLRDLAGKPAEQVFVNSVKLPSDAIVEFFTALCGVSAEELKQTPARVWARIWSVLAQHFIAAGSHHEEKVAMYAIDSLRQLGMKYLERAELTNFTFQNDILKPFVILMRNSRNEKIRSLIVDCIVQMIKSKVGSIKSGWRSVFMIFTAAADDELESIVESAFENVEQAFTSSVGHPSPSGNMNKPAEAANYQRSQTFGQRIMGNMMDNLLLRSLTSKSKNRTSDLSPVSASPVKVKVYFHSITWK
ncbi:hypothetical protein BHM03_00004390 [Ensete ventricosum]|nr:hypothetical protein BHM03_00004390 [Ensete ventricosum]